MHLSEAHALDPSLVQASSGAAKDLQNLKIKSAD
jgi:hypothetical protein